MPPPPEPSSADRELLRRLERDQARLADVFGFVRSPRAEQRLPVGDPHRGGRRVTVVTGRDRARLIYKPRSVAPELLWARVVRWLGRRAAVGPFRLPRLLARKDFGWVEFLRAGAPRSERATARFYARSGTLLSLFDILEVRDVHRDNLLAVGEHPVLVDAETVAHPRLRPFRATPSLLLTGMVPSPGARDDRAGLFTGVGQTTELAGHLESMVKGYRDGYRILQTHGSELLRRDGALSSLADTTVRVLLRPTAAYLTAIDAPDSWPLGEVASLPLPLPRGTHRSVVSVEREAMERGDVPVFEAAANGTDLLGESRTIARNCFARSGLDAIADRLGSLSSRNAEEMVGLLRTAVGLASLTRQPRAARREFGPR